MTYRAPSTVDSIAVEVGGVPTVLSADDPSFQAMVRSQYPGFAGTADFPGSASSALHFEIELLRAGELSDDEDVRVWKEAGVWRARRGDFQAEFSLQSRSGRIRQELNPYALNSVLRILHTLLLAREHGFLLHAASAMRNGSAFVFSGVSGAGKTTISRLAPSDAALLTDEISYIRRVDTHYLAWGTPFAGEMGQPGENVCAPIAKLFFLEKGSDNRIADLSKAEATRLLLRNILFFSDDQELIVPLFESVCDFLERVPVYRLTFAPGPRVWDLIQ